jgi:CubicO group peptidase (beta-lactamase class C family)
MAELDDLDLRDRVREILNRWPTAGLAVAVVRDGGLAWFYGHGVTDITAGPPVTEDTVFRIDSVTKTFTAIAVMQLCEQGLAELDAPASEYLRGYRLIPARASFRPVTLRHLLTHTAGVRAVRTAADLVRPALGWGTRAGRPVPPLAEYYRGGLHIDIEPGTHWAYSNNGFATLGQIVEDVSGQPFARYLRERIFGPLGMENSDLVRSERVRPQLATGYMLGRRGLRAVTDREIVQAGGGSIYASTADMARYAAALLGGGAGAPGAGAHGAGAHGTVLRPETLADMFAPHYQPDPRIPGMGLGFFRAEAGGHRIVSHDGIWHGFHAAMMLAPDDGVGVLAFANTGPFSPLSAAAPAASSVLRGLLGLPADVVRTGIPEQPWVWHQLCGWYSLGPGLLVDPQPRMLGGAEVAVRHGQLVIRGQIPVPAVRRGLRLYPDGDDPYAFRIGLPGYGSGTSPVVFSRAPGGEVTALHLGVLPMSFQRRRRARLASGRPAARLGRPAVRSPARPAAGP